MRKKSSLLVLLLALVLLITGCEEKETVKTNGEEVNTGKMIHKHCTRAGAATDAEVSLNYEIYYTGKKLNILIAEEKVMSEKEDVLTTYENAYKGIHEHYKGLKYYDTNVVRDANSVTSTININYDKIDIDQLIDIEGEEDNIFEDGEARVDKWLTLAKKFGTKCTIVSDESGA